MLFKVTNFCSMGCSHCMEDSTIKGEHMTWETFQSAIELTTRLESLAWSMGCPRLILLSGGECTEHPDIVRFLEELRARDFHVMLITNGMWLENDDLQKSLLRPEWGTFPRVQVTNDPRFYPRKPPSIEDERVTFVPSLTHLITLGRAARKKNLDAKGLPTRHGPTSFNLRSLTRSYASIEKAIAVLRARAMMGLSGHCSPSISEDGTLVAGETRSCFKIGTTTSSNAEITKATMAMRCNTCGLVDNLSQAEKRAIGEVSLFLGTE